MATYLRPARRADVPAMHRVRLAVRENVLVSVALTEADYVAAIEVEGRGWVVEEDGAIAGFAVVSCADGNVWALFVAPEHEGRGHGRALLDTLVAWSWSQGLQRLWLTTSPGTRAARIYDRAGWRCVGRTASGELRYELRRPQRDQSGPLTAGPARS